MKFFTALALAASGLLTSVPLAAHHGDAIYDVTAKNVTMKGSVTEWVWANPHCVLRFDVADNGQVAHWVAETTAPPSLVQRGWTKQSLKPGDQVTVTVLPVKNGRTVGRLIGVVLPDGQKLPRGESAQN
ncbi:MAG: hypothetical protein DMG32_23475 [Acidobacteria bacterium]|nr:MAG: hypothetical protein DMG32_23475 [Acidobacteriota bacterium]